MAVQPTNQLLFLLGFLQWGDFAELTMYRRPDGRVVVYNKSYPDKPPSPKQSAQRTLFLAAAEAWRALTPAQRAQWHQAAARASLCMHGRNLHAALYLRPDPTAQATIARHTHTTLVL